MVPQVHLKKLTYIFPLIAIAQHTLLQLLPLWITCPLIRNVYYKDPTGVKCVGMNRMDERTEN